MTEYRYNTKDPLYNIVIEAESKEKADEIYKRLIEDDIK